MKIFFITCLKLPDLDDLINWGVCFRRKCHKYSSATMSEYGKGMHDNGKSMHCLEAVDTLSPKILTRNQ